MRQGRTGLQPILLCAKLTTSMLLTAVLVYGIDYSLQSWTTTRSCVVVETFQAPKYSITWIIFVVERHRGITNSIVLSIFWLVMLMLGTSTSILMTRILTKRFAVPLNQVTPKPILPAQASMRRLLKTSANLQWVNGSCCVWPEVFSRRRTLFTD